MSTIAEIRIALAAKGIAAPAKARKQELLDLLNPGATIATTEGVVIAEQRHIDLPQGHSVSLINRADGSVDGHRAGCADVARIVKKERTDAPWTFEVASKREAFLDYNDDFIAEADGDETNTYAINWLPCADHVPAGEAALPADDAAEAGATPAPVEEQETAPLAPEATYDARGNYNTVFVPLAELLATDPRHAVRTWTEKESVMLVHVHVVGAGSEQFLALLQQTETDAIEAMRTWMKTLDRKGLSDMEKYNQNRSFLAGYGAAVAKRISGSKAMPVITFARDMEKALRADALKAGHVAAKAAA
jgi:hypothetical protein